MTGTMDCLLPYLRVVLAPEYGYIGTVSTRLIDSKVVKGKDIFYNTVFVLIYCALFCTCIGHHKDFFLCNCVILVLRINSHKSENTVG